jgi:ABC-type glycerol-3-phosphate transport system substrate-binding protein
MLRAEVALVGTLGILVGCGQSNAVRALVIEVPVGNAFEQVALPEGIAVTQLSYQELLRTADEQINSSRPASADIFMLDDAWVARFADNLRTIHIDQEVAKHFLPKALEMARSGDRYVGVPFVSNVQVLFYHQEFLGSRNDWNPKSWDEVVKTADKIHATHPVYGFSLRAAHGQGLVTDFLPLLWASNGNLNADGSLTSESAVRSALAQFGNLADRGSAEQFGASANELRTNFFDKKSAMGIHWTASAFVLDNEEREWTPLPGDGPAVMSTWVLATPKNISPKRASNAEAFLNRLLQSVGAQEADNLFVKAATSLKGVGVTIGPTDCKPDHGRPGHKRGGQCIYLNIRRRPPTPNWPEISDRLSYILGNVLMHISDFDEAVRDLTTRYTAPAPPRYE